MTKIIFRVTPEEGFDRYHFYVDSSTEDETVQFAVRAEWREDLDKVTFTVGCPCGHIQWTNLRQPPRTTPKRRGRRPVAPVT